MTSPKTLLLSLRPRFAAAILDGTKTIEIRRRPVNALPGTPVILYASSPVMAIVGTARLRTVESMPADMAWKRFQSSFALNRPEFDAYLDGVDTAVLLHLRAINTLNEPLPLRGLRQAGTFQPPQSFRYVAASDPAPLHRLALTA